MKKVIASLLMLILVGWHNVSFAAEITLINGYSCNDGAILKSGKAAKLAVANKQITNQLDSAKASLSALKGSKKAGAALKREKLAQKISDLKLLKKALKDCSNGSLAESPFVTPEVPSNTVLDPLYETLKGQPGAYSGSYSGTALGLPVQGSIKITYKLNGGLFSGSISLPSTTLPLLGSPIEFEFDCSKFTSSKSINVTHPTLGTVKVDFYFFENIGRVEFSANSIPTNPLNIVSVGFNNSVKDGILSGVLSASAGADFTSVALINYTAQR